MSNQLLPCPFCGHDEPTHDEGDESAWVQCTNVECGMCGPITSGPALASAAWNRRATQPAAEQLWAVHAQGPDDLFAAFSREDAEADAAAFNALPCPPGISVSAVVIESPWPAAEHWKYLAEQWKYLADKEQKSNSPPAAAHGDEAPGTVRVTADWLKTVHRDLDACQKVIWLAGCHPRVPGGFDPAYCEDAQARLKEIDEHIARAQGDEGAA